MDLGCWAYVAMPVLSFGRTCKGWVKLPASSKRQKKGQKWLRWKSEEEEGEPSMTGLQANVAMVYCMVENLRTLDLVPMDPLIKHAT